MGYTPDAPVSLRRDIRHNDNWVWIKDAETLNDKIFERCRKYLPQYVDLYNLLSDDPSLSIYAKHNKEEDDEPREVKGWEKGGEAE